MLRSVLILLALALGAVRPPAAAFGATPDDGEVRADPVPDLTLRMSVTSSATEEAEPAGLDLPDLIDLALDESFQVRVSRAQIEEARALHQLAITQGFPFPRGQARVLFGGPTPEARTRVQNDITTITESSLEGDLDFGELGVTTRGNAEAAIPLWGFGQIAAGKRAAAHLVRASKHQVTATRGQVIVDLTRAYWGWQLLKNLIASLEEGQERLDVVLEQIEELLDVDSPQVTENDRLRLKFAVSTLSVRQAQAEGGLEQLSQGIRLLIGRPQGAPLQLREEKLEQATRRKLPPLEELIDGARNNRPELAALDAVIEAQAAFEDLRRAQLFPVFFFGGFLNFAVTTNATDQTNPFIKDPFNFFDAGVGLGFQLELDFFSKLAQVEQAEAQLGVRRQQRTLAVEASELEVRSLYAQVDAERQQMQRLERANLSARGWLTASTLAYDVGAGQADELLDAFLAWATSIAELQSTRYDNLVHLAELARATGRLIGLRGGD